ncbi:hypothetical protein Hanom_Chr06g00519821 [Helianthus anomalus]
MSQNVTLTHQSTIVITYTQQVRFGKLRRKKINDIYVFTKGCPKLFHDLRIEDDDTLLLMKTDSNTFELKIYRRGVEVVLTNKEESEDDSVLEIPKDTYYKNVQFTFCDDDDSIDQLISEVLT